MKVLIDDRVFSFDNPHLEICTALDEEGNLNEEKCMLCDFTDTEMHIEGDFDGYMHYSCWHFVFQCCKNYQCSFEDSLTLIKNKMFGGVNENK